MLLKVLMSTSCQLLDAMFELSGLLYRKVVIVEDENCLQSMCTVLADEIKIVKSL